MDQEARYQEYLQFRKHQAHEQELELQEWRERNNQRAIHWAGHWIPIFFLISAICAFFSVLLVRYRLGWVKSIGNYMG